MKFPVDFFSAESLDNIFSNLGHWCQLKLNGCPTANAKRATQDEQYLEGWLFTVDPTHGNVILVKNSSEASTILSDETTEVGTTVTFRVLFIAGDSVAELTVTDLLPPLPPKTLDSMIRQWSGGNPAHSILDINSMRTKREKILRLLETQNIPIHNPDSSQEQISEQATKEGSLEPVYLLDDASLVIQPPYLTVQLSSSATTNWKNGLTLKKVKAMLAGMEGS